MDQNLIEYFIKETDKKFEKMGSRFDTIDEKLDLLFKFKWQIIGGSALASLLVSVVIAIWGYR